MFYKLLLRVLPNSFDSNSIYAHLPMVTPKTNKEIMADLGRKSRYKFDDEDVKSPPRLRLIDPSAVEAVMGNKLLVTESWKPQLNYLMGKPGLHIGPYGTDFERRRARLEEHLFRSELREEFKKALEGFSHHLQSVAISIGGANGTRQIDIVEDFANIGQFDCLGSPVVI